MLIPHFPQLLRRAQHLMVTTCIPHHFLTYTTTLSSINTTHRLYIVLSRPLIGTNFYYPNTALND